MIQLHQAVMLIDTFNDLGIVLIRARKFSYFHYNLVGTIITRSARRREGRPGP